MFLTIQQAEPGPVNFVRRFPIGRIPWEERQAIEVDEARIEGQIVPARDGHLLRGRLEAAVRLNCARCLEDYEYPFQASVVRIYVTDPEPPVEGESEERRMQTDEIPLARYDGRRIDLRALAVEQVYLELPLKPVCRDDCRGLCPRCGANRNRVECDCVDEAGDPRLSVLKTILNRS
jgi:uncharacterized protein